MVQLPASLAARREVPTAGTEAGVPTICSSAHVNSRWNPSGFHKCRIKTRSQGASLSFGGDGALADHTPIHAASNGFGQIIGSIGAGQFELVAFAPPLTNRGEAAAAAPSDTPAFGERAE